MRFAITIVVIIGVFANFLAAHNRDEDGNVFTFLQVSSESK
jgi:hypothetical protein